MKRSARSVLALVASTAMIAFTVQTTAVPIAAAAEPPGTPVPSFVEPELTVPESGVSFVVYGQLSAPALDNQDVRLVTRDGTATASGDYVATEDFWRFRPGDTNAQFEVYLLAGNQHEETETFFVDVVDFDGGVVATQTITITDDDDPEPSEVSIDDVDVDEDVDAASLTVSRTGDLSSEANIDAVPVDGSAVANDDYVPASWSVHFSVGQATEIVTFEIVDDAVFESTESFTVELSNPQSLAIGKGTGTITIADNDIATPPPGPGTVSAGEYEVDEGAGSAVITLTRSGPVPPVAASVDWTTGLSPMGEGFATPGVDYTVSSGKALFAAGSAEAQFTIPITDDALDEGPEVMAFLLANPIGVSLGEFVGIITINDNDAPPTMSIEQLTPNPVSESSFLVGYRVSLDHPSSVSVTASLSTSDMSASQGPDFGPIGIFGNPASIVTFAPGETEKDFGVVIVDDAIPEADEQFSVDLGTPNRGSLGTSSVVTTISDNDGPTVGSFWLTQNSLFESTSDGTIILSRDGGLDSTASVDWATSDGVALAGSDYTASSGTAVFDVGSSTTTLHVPITDDAVYDPSQDFFITLSNPVGGAIDPEPVQYVITDNEPLPTISLTPADSALSESAGPVELTVHVDGGFEVPLNVRATTQDGSALSGDDFGALDTVEPATSGVDSTVEVSLVDDQTVEPDESFGVTVELLRAPTGSGGAAIEQIKPKQSIASASVVILNDDVSVPVGSVSVANVEVGEDHGSAVVTLTRDGDLSGSANVNLATVGGTALQGEDFAGTSVTAEFGPGQASVQVEVAINDDNIDEPNQAFGIELSNPEAVNAGTMSSTVTIVDNDEAPTVSIVPELMNVSEGSAPGVGFDIVLSNPSEFVVGMHFETSDGTAVAGSDYTAVDADVVFGADSLSQHVVVPILNDTVIERNETVFGVLSAADNAYLGTSKGTLVIVDNEPRSMTGSVRTLSLTRKWTQPSPGDSIPDAVIDVSPSTGTRQVLSVATDAMAAADGSACDSDADKVSGCTISLGLSSAVASVTERPTAQWLPTFGSGCNTAVSGDVLRGNLAKGTADTTCAVTNTYVDVVSPAGGALRPLMVTYEWGPPPGFVGIPDRSFSVGGMNVSTTLMRAADGSACDSDADKRTYCWIKVGVPASGWTVTAPNLPGWKAFVGSTSACSGNSLVVVVPICAIQIRGGLVTVKQVWSAPVGTPLPEVPLTVTNASGGSFPITSANVRAADGSVCDTDAERAAGCTSGIRAAEQLVLDPDDPAGWLTTFSGSCPASIAAHLIGVISGAAGSADSTCTLTHTHVDVVSPAGGALRPLMVTYEWGPPPGFVGIPDRSFSVGGMNVSTTLMRAADGSACDSDADKRTYCWIKVGVPASGWTVTAPNLPGWKAFVGSTSACSGNSLVVVVPICAIQIRGGLVTVKQVWSAPVGTPLPEVPLTVTNASGGSFPITSANVRAADGSVCDTDAERAAGCTSGIRAAEQLVLDPDDPAGWLTTFSGSCPASIAAHLIGVISGAAGSADSTCTLTHTHVDVVSPAGGALRPLMVTYEWGPPPGFVGIPDRSFSVGGMNVSTTLMRAADGSACDSDADKRTYCWIKVGVPASGWTVTAPNLPGWKAFVGSTSACSGNSLVVVVPICAIQIRGGLVTVKQVWSAPVGTPLPEVPLTVTNASGGSFPITSANVRAADGSVCDTDAERAAGCTSGIRAAEQLVLDPDDPAGWLTTFSGSCPASIAAHLIGVISGAAGSADSTCTLTHTHVDVVSPAGGALRPLMVTKKWSARAGVLGLPVASFTATSGTSQFSFSSLSMRAADGSACDTDADKRAGCTITIGVPAADWFVGEPTPPLGWTPSFAGTCSGTSLAGVPTCKVTNTKQ